MWPPASLRPSCEAGSEADTPGPLALASADPALGGPASLGNPPGGPCLVAQQGISACALAAPSPTCRQTRASLADCLQVAARACLAIGASLNLCGACGAHGGEVRRLAGCLAAMLAPLAACECRRAASAAGQRTPTALASYPPTPYLQGLQPSPQQLGELAAQLVGALRAHPAEPAVAAAGLHLLLRLAGCAACRLPTGRELQDALGAAGAVPAAAAALGALASNQPCSSRSSASSDGGGAAPPPQQQQHAGALCDGLQALHYMCNRHAGNLAQLGACGGMQVVAAAMAAASTEWPAEEHGLLLLAQLACRQDASAEEQQAAALAIWQAAQAQVERRLVEVGRAAVWGMARLLQRLQEGAAASASPAAAQLVGELQLQGAAVALAMLQSCDKKVRMCCGGVLPCCASEVWACRLCV